MLSLSLAYQKITSCLMRSSAVKGYCEEYFHAAATHFTFPKALAKPSKCTHVLRLDVDFKI